MRFDTTGKVSLDHIYTQPDPRAYFGTLRELDYRIPQSAKPHFAGLLAQYRATVQAPATPTVVDIGCSYGINAALLKCGASMQELYRHYGGAARALSRERLLARDRELVRTRTGRAPVRFVGLDSSRNALSYALSAGFLDRTVHADLEVADPTEHQAELLSGADLVVSTGCLGYVTGKTIARVVGAQGGRLPWMAHFVLRMFPYDPIADLLDAAGYRTERVDGVFRQRRFAGPEERSQVLDTLTSVGVDPCGLETDGWFYAQLYVSRPRGTRRP